MNTKPFLLLLVAVLVLGGSIGGAFVGGIAVGKGQGPERSQIRLSSVAPTTGSGRQLPGQTDQQTLDQIRQRIQSGEANQEEIADLRQQLQGPFRGAATAGASAVRAGIIGTIERIDESTITLNTQQGILEAAVGTDTIVQITTEVSLADLKTGMQVTITGERGEKGGFDARTIFVIPEGAVGRGFRSDGGFAGGLRGGAQGDRANE